MPHKGKAQRQLEAAYKMPKEIIKRAQKEIKQYGRAIPAGQHPVKFMEKISPPKMKIFCFRDLVVPYYLPRTRGKKRRKHSPVFGDSRAFLGVNLYFVLPDKEKVKVYFQGEDVRQHFKENVLKWQEGEFTYEESELSVCEADESYFGHDIVKLHPHERAFSFEIGEPTEPPRWRYSGFYSRGSWHGSLSLPKDWDIKELERLIKEVLK